MTVVKRFDVLSVGLMMGATYACLGLIAGAFLSLIALMGAAAAPGGGGGGPGAMLMGVGAIIVVPLFYGVLGFIGGLISALIYNVVAGIAGGIKVELADERDVRRRPSRDDDYDDDER